MLVTCGQPGNGPMGRSAANACIDCYCIEIFKGQISSPDGALLKRCIFFKDRSQRHIEIDALTSKHRITEMSDHGASKMGFHRSQTPFCTNAWWGFARRASKVLHVYGLVPFVTG